MGWTTTTIYVSFLPSGIQVCNHPELFERNEGSSYFHFGDITNSLLPPPFGELEDVFYSGGRNPVVYEVILIVPFPVPITPFSLLFIEFYSGRYQSWSTKSLLAVQRFITPKLIRS